MVEGSYSTLDIEIGKQFAKDKGRRHSHFCDLQGRPVRIKDCLYLCLASVAGSFCPSGGRPGSNMSNSQMRRKCIYRFTRQDVCESLGVRYDRELSAACEGDAKPEICTFATGKLCLNRPAHLHLRAFIHRPLEQNAQTGQRKSSKCRRNEGI